MADLYAKYSCSYCQDEINGLRVRCAECVDFDICLQCFSAGAEIGSHRNDHSYQIMDSGSVGVFQGRGSWSAKEQVRLLDAIEQFGFGNWEDISKHIETRSSEEAKDEYISRYLEGSVGRATWGAVGAASRPSLHCAERDLGPLGPSALARLPTLAVTPEEAAQLGYMPNRDDFEREHDHEAEHIISTLCLNVDDDDLDVALKLSQVDVYTRRLRERTRRKRLVRDYQLVSAFFSNARSRHRPLTKLAKERKDFTERLRAFAQFYARAEHSALAAGLWRERELRLRLAELHRYRLAGVTRAEECAHYEQHAAQRRRAAAAAPPHARPSALFNIYAGSSACQAGSQASRDEPTSRHHTTHSTKRRESESGSSSTSPKCTPDESTGFGCFKRHICSSSASRQLLTTNEIQLCTSLNLPPTQYITMKTVLLRNHNHKKHPAVKQESVEEAGGSLETIVSRYLQSAGWISAS